jgi:hypothetical protein
MPPNDRKKLDAALGRERQLAKATPSEPDIKTREEERDLEGEKKKTVIRGLGQNIKERKKYAECFFVLACCWLLSITVVVLLEGFGAFLRFRLSDNVVLALIGSTTVNVLGILYVVANYLFPKK